MRVMRRANDFILNTMCAHPRSSALVMDERKSGHEREGGKNPEKVKQTPHPAQTVPGLLLGRSDIETGNPGEILAGILRALRVHLGLDIAFVSRFQQGQRVFQYVDADPRAPSVQPGESHPLEESYCQRLVDGRLPELIPDVAQLPEAQQLPATQALSIGSYLGVPIRLSDGSVYGTFCCIGSQADPSLRQRDVDLVRTFAEIAGQLLEQDLQRTQEVECIRERIQALLTQEGMSMVFQPIRNLQRGRTVGVEALARFASPHAVSTERWFDEAARAGMGPELELRAVTLALAALHTLPTDVYLACNVSPELALDARLYQLLQAVPHRRLVLEITEHASIRDYERLTEALAPLRRQGLRLAVDDAGAGYASFRHILALQPDFIKLDMSLTRSIDSDKGRRALAAALIRFAEETGCQLVAEGVETEAELAVLRAMGANLVQGYWISQPLAFERMRALLDAERRA